MAMQLRPLSESLQEKAKRELNEIPSQIGVDLEHLKDWLAKQEYLKCRKDDQLLLNFLRGSKHSLQRAKEKLDGYYTYRTIVPEVLKNLDPLLPNIQAFLKAGICVPLATPPSDPASPRVLFIRFGSYDADEITATTMMHAAAIIIDILLNEDDNFAVAGAKAIFDMKGIQFKTLMQTTPTIIQKTAFFHEKAYPTRLKTFYFINIPSYWEPALNMFKLLISKKLANRLNFCSNDDWESIYADIPKCVLPKEYGGEAGLYEDIAAEWKKTVESHRDRLLAESNYYSNESQRPGTPKTVETLFGIEGSFRKLQID